MVIESQKSVPLSFSYKDSENCDTKVTFTHSEPIDVYCTCSVFRLQMTEYIMHGK